MVVDGKLVTSRWEGGRLCASWQLSLCRWLQARQGKEDGAARMHAVPAAFPANFPAPYPINRSCGQGRRCSAPLPAPCACRGPGTAFEFALALVRELYGEEKMREVAGPMVMAPGWDKAL